MIPRFRWIDAALVIILLAGASVGLSPLYQSKLGVPALSLIKLSLLALAAGSATIIAMKLGKKDTVRIGWALMAIGLTFYSLGQLSLAFYQFRGLTPPFPSIADLWFALGVPAIFIAMMWFVLFLLRSGLPVGSPFRHYAIMVGLGVVLSVLLYFLLLPIWESGGAHVAEGSKSLEVQQTVSSWLSSRWVNTYYTVTSAILLIPAVVLFRITQRFRGGRLVWAWGVMTVGMVAILVGDILFAYQSISALSSLTPRIMTVLYLVGYIGLFRGILYHKQLLVGDGLEHF